MAWRRTKTGREWVANAFPEPPVIPEIPEHLWIGLELSLKANPGDTRTIVKNFSKIFEIPVTAVLVRIAEQIEAEEERHTAVLH